ncbi:hypothetical protein [Pseudalkalibacillus caeni]|uniref:hypothetical protein n=1 Tax=Exobacillus caeni TaxID=2574798 RepID=UPI001485562D|nr:hypothetical protein [Pseudalkalibacillus caeni]
MAHLQFMAGISSALLVIAILLDYSILEIPSILLSYLLIQTIVLFILHQYQKHKRKNG